MIEDKNILMIYNAETDLEITMKSPRVDIADSKYLGEFWVFVN